MSRSRLTVVLITTAVVLAVLGSSRDAAAIPAFARKYQLSCSTCHAPVPRLKPFGEEFAGRGFRLEDPAQEPARAVRDVGDPTLKLFRELPLAMRLDGYVSYKEDEAADTDFELPWFAKLLSGGQITDSMSYYLYAIIEKGESLKLEDTWVQFNSVFKLPVDIMAGQFQVSDPLFKRELRLERNDYAIFKARVGVLPTDLTYDRGFVVTWHAPAAVDVIAQLVNGNGIDEADDGNFDDNGLKNWSLRLVRPFGPVRVGLLGYRGCEETEDGAFDTQITYYGPDLVVDLGDRWQVNLEYLERLDQDPFLVGREGDDLETRGGFAEVHFFPQGPDGKWVLTALYNQVQSDLPEVEAENASLTLNYLVARNVRLSLEGFRDLDLEQSRVSLGLMAAF